VVDHVSFAYTGTARLAPDDVRLTLPAGATVALVGENGAGKSTLVKLLCRFYDPTSGAITVDGVDLRELDLQAWRAVTTGAFQDFVRLHVLARESVGTGELHSIEDRARVQAAAAAGASAPFLELLSDGYETPLGRELAGGADLSEGQWQKVALSRGLMRAAPLLVVLDEPTAALDARAEHALFERYAAEAARARRRGAVTLVVSHRFSTVRVADRIVVLESGRVAESGTHAELMVRQGGYAELYTLQADGYR
jgi:ABC-type multidrug transport system fused ATPase/permease subunit